MNKKGCIKFLNRNGEIFYWENDGLSDLEVVSAQPKVVNPGVANILLDDGSKEDLGGVPEVKEKPPYAMMAIAARRRAGLDVEPEPRQSKGVEVRTADVIVIDDDCDKVQVEVPAPEALSLAIKIEQFLEILTNQPN